MCKYLVFLSMTLIASVAVAGDGNGYLGAGAGLAITTGSGVDRSLGHFNLPTFGDVNIPFMASNQFKNNSFKGALFAGYGRTWQRYYLGAEAFVDRTNYKVNHAGSGGESYVTTPPNITEIEPMNSSYSAKVSPGQYGLDLRPGIFLEDHTLIFARVGFAIATQTISGMTSTSQNFILPANGGAFNYNLPLNHSKTSAVLRLGLGVERPISSQLNVRADYIYTDYGSISAASSIPAHTVSSRVYGAGVNSVTKSSSASLATSNLLLSLIYRI